MNDNDTREPIARAKRSDLDAMQARFDAILAVTALMDARVEESGAVDLDANVNIIRRLALGSDLDSIIREAGIRALGLES